MQPIIAKIKVTNKHALAIILERLLSATNPNPNSVGVGASPHWEPI